MVPKSWNLFWSPNGSRTNITAWNLDRSARNFSARLFHFQKNTKSDILRARKSNKQKKRPCEERTTTDPVVGRNPIHGSNSYLIPIQLKSYTHRAEIPPTGGTWSNTILVNSLPLDTLWPDLDNFWRMPQTSSAALLSNPLVGSSRKRTDGRVNSSKPMHTRLRWPPLACTCSVS